MDDIYPYLPKNLINLTISTPIPSNIKNDKLAWGPRSYGKYDIKSAYRIIYSPNCYFNLSLINWKKL